jgi:hypothetical protein
VKKVARQLLERVRSALVLGWREKAQARALIRLTIEDTLDDGLPRAYTPDLFQAKCATLFEHPQRQDSCRSLARLNSGARRQRFGDETVLPGI